MAFSSTRTRDASGGHHVWLGDHLLIIALIAGALGFGVVAGTAFAAAKIIFVVALIALLISAVLGVTRRGAL